MIYGIGCHFAFSVLQESLFNTLSSQRRLHARLSASGRRLRVIVVTPGYLECFVFINISAYIENGALIYIARCKHQRTLGEFES